MENKRLGFIKQILFKLRLYFRKEYKQNNSITRETALINIRRLYYITIIAWPVNLIHVVLFLLKNPSTTQETNWKWGVITVHSTLGIIMFLSSILLFFLKNRAKTNFFIKTFPFFCISLILISGIALVAIDQLVTTNVTPFIIACVISAVILFMRPSFSISFYIIAYGLFYFAIGKVQNQEVILLTNRVNGITIIAIGICISIILWQTNRLNLFQKRKIERQQLELIRKNQLLVEANRELENISIIDELTKIYNRRYFNISLEKEINRHKMTSQSISLILCDVDYFKNYNDSLGHLEGDNCLQVVAKVIRDSIEKPFNIAARYGGEEFVIILPRTNTNGAISVASKIKANFSNFALKHPDSKVSKFVTLSFGIITVIPDEFTKSEDLIHKADQALYYSKHNGRDQYTVYKDEMNLNPA